MSGEFRCFVANSSLIGEYGMMLGVKRLHQSHPLSSQLFPSVTAHSGIPTLQSTRQQFYKIYKNFFNHILLENFQAKIVSEQNRANFILKFT